jgi:hypothetical protein
MSRRFEVGPILVALGAIVLVVSLFLDWYGSLTAWEAFEVVEIMLGALAVTALVIAIGQLVPDLEYADRRWLPPVVLGVAVLVAAEIVNPPPAAGGEGPSTGAWIAFGAALVMFLGAVLTFGRLRLAISLEGREVRRRVAVVDHRQDTTETAAIAPDEAPPARGGRKRTKAADTTAGDEGTPASD